MFTWHFVFGIVAALVGRGLVDLFREWRRRRIETWLQRSQFEDRLKHLRPGSE